MTWMIKDMIDEGPKVLLFTRPRRFGKTLNMSMLSYFFGSKEPLFDHLAIDQDHSEQPWFCYDHKCFYSSEMTESAGTSGGWICAASAVALVDGSVPVAKLATV